ncbi:hypothetical protein DPMN_016187 [Dreissena polymorpha]|uniref:Uncharacterized protein n=1 Tax=Dreissena polymorpha TaxID=45954 RepID=A0A9D4NCV7_DREPO|nr:hypothetical protein DPMN_016187 [Dreissena polymorpha]
MLLYLLFFHMRLPLLLSLLLLLKMMVIIISSSKEVDAAFQAEENGAHSVFANCAPLYADIRLLEKSLARVQTNKNLYLLTTFTAICPCMITQCKMGIFMSV